MDNDAKIWMLMPFLNTTSKVETYALLNVVVLICNGLYHSHTLRAIDRNLKTLLSTIDQTEVHVRSKLLKTIRIAKIRAFLNSKLHYKIGISIEFLSV